VDGASDRVSGVTEKTIFRAHLGEQRCQSNALARALQAEMARTLEGPDRGVKLRNFSVLRETYIPAALVEIGFISHRDTERKMRCGWYRQRVAEVLEEGLAVYAGGQRNKLERIAGKSNGGPQLAERPALPALPAVRRAPAPRPRPAARAPRAAFPAPAPRPPARSAVTAATSSASPRWTASASTRRWSPPARTGAPSAGRIARAGQRETPGNGEDRPAVVRTRTGWALSSTARYTLADDSRR
jgi:hypothetical protein